MFIEKLTWFIPHETQRLNLSRGYRLLCVLRRDCVTLSSVFHVFICELVVVSRSTVSSPQSRVTSRRSPYLQTSHHFIVSLLQSNAVGRAVLAHVISVCESFLTLEVVVLRSMVVGFITRLYYVVERRQPRWDYTAMRCCISSGSQKFSRMKSFG